MRSMFVMHHNSYPKLIARCIKERITPSNLLCIMAGTSLQNDYHDAPLCEHGTDLYLSGVRVFRYTSAVRYVINTRRKAVC